MFFCLIHVSLCCGLMDSCMFTTDGRQTWDTGQNFLKLTSSLSLPFHCIHDRLWTRAGSNKTFNAADCVGSPGLEKFDLGVFTRSLPFPLWSGTKNVHFTRTLFLTNAAHYFWQTLLLVLLHTLLAQVKPVISANCYRLMIFLACRNFREGLKNYLS